MKSSYQHRIWYSSVILSPIFHSVWEEHWWHVLWIILFSVWLAVTPQTDRLTYSENSILFLPAWAAEWGLMWHFNLQGIINYTDLLELYFKQTILSTSNIFCIDLFLNLLAINLSPCYRSPCYQSPSYWSPGYLSLSISLKFFGYILPPPIANCPNT